MEKASLIVSTGPSKMRSRISRPLVMIAVTAICALCVLIAAVSIQRMKIDTSVPSELLTQELVLFKMAPPPEPWSPPENLWMYWGDAPNKRFGHSGDNLRHLVRLGRIAGGEYRDPHFLESFTTATFRDLSESCCTAMLVAPMKHNMPIWNSYSNIAQRLRNYVANGNHMIFTGGSLVSMEFINTYFWYNIEPTSGEAGYFDGTGYGNWSPGPWRKLVDKSLPWVFKMTPDTLYQDHISVQTAQLASLPDGARIIYMSPQS